jgi:hypothetical protein
MKEQKHDNERKVAELRNALKSSQIELDMERNQMSAQEEMLHDMVHNISMEFASFAQKNQQVRPSIDARISSKKKKEKEQESFYLEPS